MPNLCIDKPFIRLSKSHDAYVEVSAVFVKYLSVPTVKTEVHLKSLKHDDGKPASVTVSERRQYPPVIGV